MRVLTERPIRFNGARILEERFTSDTCVVGHVRSTTSARARLGSVRNAVIVTSRVVPYRRNRFGAGCVGAAETAGQYFRKLSTDGQCQ